MKHGFPVTARKTISDNEFIEVDMSQPISTHRSGRESLAKGGSTNRSKGVSKTKQPASKSRSPTRSVGSNDSGKGQHLNFDSELEMTQDDIASDDTEFLHKTIPSITVQKPACFCNGGSFCPNHQGNEPKMLGMIKLLTK